MAGRKIGEAFIRVRPDTGMFTREATPAMTSSGEHSGRTFGSAFKGALTGVAAAVGVLLAGRAVLGFAGEALAEARQAAQVGRLTEAVIKSTGGAAKVSSGHVADLAESVSNLVGVDDEAIQGAENLLLTFTNIRNAAGKGNQVFDEATQAIVDMTAAMNHGTVSEEGLHSATIQVGKALNDPIKGITALRKVGVAFTDDQVKQIKALVASGKTMEAQKIILKELKTEFGGAAAAAADPAQRAAVAWDNFKERLGNLVLPVVGRLATVFTDRVLPVLEDRLVPALQRAGAWIRDVLVPAFRDHAIPALREFARWVGEEVLPRLRALWGYLQANVLPILQDLAQRAFAGVREAIAAVKTAIAEHHDQLITLRNAFKTVIDFVVEKVLPVLGPILTFLIHGTIGSIQLLIFWISLMVDVFRAIKDAVISAKNWVVSAFNTVVGFVQGLPGRISSAVSGMWDGLKSAFRSAINWIIDKWNGLEFKVPGFSLFGKSFGGITIGVPDIPHLDSGGIITKTGIAEVHRGETVTPAGASWSKADMRAFAEMIARVLADVVSGRPVVLMLDGKQLAFAVDGAHLANERRGPGR